MVRDWKLGLSVSVSLVLALGASGCNSYSGSVYVAQQTDGSSVTTSVYAFFYRGSDDFPGCTSTSSGACTLESCDIKAAAAAMPYNAGIISLTGGSLGSPLGIGGYSVESGYSAGPSQSVQAFVPGQTLHVSAPGADVPSFSGSSAPAPTAITLTSPLATTLPSASNLEFAWTGEGAGSRVRVTLTNGSTSSTEQTFVNCDFDASLGGGSVSSGLLSQLGPAGGFTVAPASEAQLSGSDVSVAFVLQGSSVDGSYQMTP